MKHINIPEYQARATVSDDCPQEVINALKEMCRLAYYGLGKDKRKSVVCDHDNVVAPTASDFYCPKCQQIINWLEYQQTK